jgi:regulatory protein
MRFYNRLSSCAEDHDVARIEEPILSVECSEECCLQSKKKTAPLDEPALYDYAIRMLGRRMRTVAELKRLMQPRVEDEDSGQARIIRNALELSYESASEEELARQHLTRKRINPPTSDKESARVVRLLLRAGFSGGVIFKVVKEWQVSDETLASLEAIDTKEQEFS